MVVTRKLAFDEGRQTLQSLILVSSQQKTCPIRPFGENLFDLSTKVSNNFDEERLEAVAEDGPEDVFQLLRRLGDRDVHVHVQDLRSEDRKDNVCFGSQRFVYLGKNELGRSQLMNN